MGISFLPRSIVEFLLVKGKRRTPAIQMTVSAMSSEQRALYDALDLGRYLAS
jgi:hypothetical protein